MKDIFQVKLDFHLKYKEEKEEILEEELNKLEELFSEEVPTSSEKNKITDSQLLQAILNSPFYKQQKKNQ